MVSFSDHSSKCVPPMNSVHITCSIRNSLSCVGSLLGVYLYSEMVIVGCIRGLYCFGEGGCAFCTIRYPFKETDPNFVTCTSPSLGLYMGNALGIVPY